MTIAPGCGIIEPIRKYQPGTKTTSRIQASRLRAWAARLCRTATSSCWRMTVRPSLDPSRRQMADPVETLLLEHQVGDDEDGRARGPQLPGQVPEGQVGLPVEALVGLVEEEQRGLMQQGQGQAELLPGPSGQGAGGLVAGRGVAEPGDQGRGPLRGRDPVGGLEVADV